jgi:phosphatidylserine/phosphatidylglycerophosphate/cardiolipin synthase-like enzyme
VNQKLLNKIEDKDTSIRNLLKQQNFTIEYLQREYRWEERHIIQLIDNLSVAFFKSFQKNHAPKNFNFLKLSSKLITLIFALAQTVFAQTPSSPPAAKIGDTLTNNAHVRVHFAPEDSLAEETAKEIAKAKNSITMQTYKFTSNTISLALIAARKRGVTVEVILDKDHKIPDKEALNESVVDSLLRGGIPVYVDSEHIAARNNVMVIDSMVVITGSYSFTDTEKTNAENILIIDNHQIARDYTAKWAIHKNHSKLSGNVTGGLPPATGTGSERNDIKRPTPLPRPQSKIKTSIKKPTPPTRPKK